MPGPVGPDPAEAVVVEAVDVGEGGVLGHADAFEDQHAGGVEEPGDLWVDRRGARDAPTHPSAEGLLDLGEDELGGEAVLQPEQRGDRLLGELEVADLGAHLDRPVEDLERQPTLGLGAGDDLGVDLLVDPRHAREPVRTGDPEILGDGVDAAREDGRGAREECGEDAGAGKDVGERQEEQGHVAVLGLERSGSIDCAVKVMLSWVRTAPFGTPVVPEV